MASNKQAWGLCDVCGWRYRLKDLKSNSYGLLVCPTDYEGRYDLNNNPQNKAASMKENEAIKNPRIDPYTERNAEWATTNSSWEDMSSNWNNT